MSLCLEITPKEHIHYEMPEWLADAMGNALDRRAVRTMRAFVAMLPDDIKEHVKITRHPRPPVVNHPEINWVFYDELASPEAILGALEYERLKADRKAGEVWRYLP